MEMDEAKSGSKKDRLSIFFAFAAIYIIWGSTYLAILIGLIVLPPFLMSAIRFLVAGLLLYGWCVFKGKQQPDISSLQKNTLYGIFMLVGGTVSVTWAEQYLPSSLAAIIVSSLPFWFVVLDKKQWQFYFSNKFIIAGLILGFAGVALFVGFGSTGYSSNLGTGNQLTGILVILTGGLAWTIGSLYSKYYPAKTSLLINAAIQLLSAGVFCMVVSLLAGEWRNFSFAAIKTSSWLAVLYLIIMGSLIA